MANFDSAVNYVLKNEGGLVEDPSDPGGITNFGISLRFLREVPIENLKRYSLFDPVTDKDIRELTLEQAKLIYRGEFWEAGPFEKLQNQILCNYIFDMCVSFGITQAIKLVQRAVWSVQKKKDFIPDDGIFGPYTIQAINQASFMLMFSMVAQRDGYYRQIVAVNPSRKPDLEGWLNRCYNF